MGDKKVQNEKEPGPGAAAHVGSGGTVLEGLPEGRSVTSAQGWACTGFSAYCLCFRPIGAWLTSLSAVLVMTTGHRRASPSAVLTDRHVVDMSTA